MPPCAPLVVLLPSPMFPDSGGTKSLSMAGLAGGCGDHGRITVTPLLLDHLCPLVFLPEISSSVAN